MCKQATGVTPAKNSLNSDTYLIDLQEAVGGPNYLENCQKELPAFLKPTVDSYSIHSLLLFGEFD